MKIPEIAPIPPVAADGGLVRASRQLEGAFVEQLFKAMRETVPEGGLTSGGSGEEIFASLMDQHLAEQVPARWTNGLGASLVRQLRGAVSPEAPARPPTAPGPEV